MQAGLGVILDILSGEDGLLMMCLLWINAQRMTSCINDLYNTSQQLSLILVLFPRVHCNQSSCEYLATGLHPPLHGLSFSFRLSGIVLVTGSSSEDWVKELCVRPEAVPLLSQFSASPWKLQFLSQSLTHTQPGGERGN